MHLNVVGAVLSTGYCVNALKNVDTFKYLGSCINSAANLDDDVLCPISRASQAFGCLHTRVWHERGISIKTKLSVYRAVVLPSLLYGCETWTCYRRHTKNWTSSTCTAFAKFSLSAGRTMCQTRRSFAGLSSLALKPC